MAPVLAKAQVRFAQARSPVVHHYTSHGIILQYQGSTKHLGVTLASTRELCRLDWNTHIQDISGKANRTLGFLSQNVWRAPRKSRKLHITPWSAASFSTVLLSGIHTPEIISIRWTGSKGGWCKFVQQSHYNTSSVTGMLDQVGWESLEHSTEGTGRD